MTTHKTGTRQEWLAARLELLEAEKDLTHRSDELARRRQELPWVRIDKEYRFDTDEGSASLADLFRGRSQLLVYHFMFGPDYEAGCVTCSSIADGFDAMLPHLAARDVTMVTVSRAPLTKLLTYKERMGWRFLWVSSGDSDFSFDFGGSSTEEATRAWVEPILGQLPPIAAQNASASGTDVVHYLSDSQGVSSFARDGDDVYHTYSSGGRGVEFLMGYYSVLDRVPKGRDEGDDFQTWLRRHDDYET